MSLDVFFGINDALYSKLDDSFSFNKDLTPYSASSKKAVRDKLVAFIESENTGKININIKTKEGHEKKIQLRSY